MFQDLNLFILTQFKFTTLQFKKLTLRFYTTNVPEAEQHERVRV